MPPGGLEDVRISGLRADRWSSDQAEFLADCGECFDGLIELAGVVAGADLAAQAGFAARDYGVSESAYKHAVLE